MVNINLLRDDESSEGEHREDEYQEPYDLGEQPAEGEQQAASDEDSWEERAGEQGVFDEEFEPRRSKAPWILLSIFVVLALIVVAYFWGPLRKRAPGGDETQVGEVTTLGEAEEGAGGEAPSATSREALEHSQAASVSQSISTVLSRIPQDAQLRSYSYSLGKFYLELDGLTQGVAERFVQELQALAPEAGISWQFRGATRPGVPRRALVSGSIGLPTESAQVAGLSSVDPEIFDEKARSLCETLGLVAVSISSSPPVQAPGVVRIPTRVVVRGDKTAEGEFLHQLSGEGMAILFSRVLMTPSRGRTGAPGFFDMTISVDLLQQG